MQNDTWNIDFVEPLERRGKSPPYTPLVHTISIREGASRKLKSTAAMISEIAKIRREVQLTGFLVWGGVKKTPTRWNKLDYHNLKNYVKDDLIETIADLEIKNSGETTEANLKFPAKISQIRIAMSQLSDVIDKSAMVNTHEALAALLNLITSERLISPWFQPSIFSGSSIDELEKAKDLIGRLEDSIDQIEADLTDDQRSDSGIINSTIDSLEELDVRRDKFLQDAASKFPTTNLAFPKIISENTSINPMPEMWAGKASLSIPAWKEGGYKTLTQLSLTSIDESCLVNLEARRDEKISLSWSDKLLNPGIGTLLKRERKEFERNIQEIHNRVSDFYSRLPALKDGAVELLGEYNSIIDSANEAMTGNLFFPKLENY